MTNVFRFSTVALVVAMFMGQAAPALAQSNGSNGADDVKITHYNDWEVRCPKSVSYTHLTLPTICSV